jgi:sRNA-binding protein
MSKTIWPRVRATQAALAQIYPALFSLESPVPFKIGLDADVGAEFPEMPASVRWRLFLWLTARKAYLAAHRPGAQRYGLAGPDGTVDERGAAYAARRLRERIERDAARELARLANG